MKYDKIAVIILTKSRHKSIYTQNTNTVVFLLSEINTINFDPPKNCLNIVLQNQHFHLHIGQFRGVRLQVCKSFSFKVRKNKHTLAKITSD